MTWIAPLGVCDPRLQQSIRPCDLHEAYFKIYAATFRCGYFSWQVGVIAERWIDENGWGDRLDYWLEELNSQQP